MRTKPEFAHAERPVPALRAEVNGGGGHFNIEVTSLVCAGKNIL